MRSIVDKNNEGVGHIQNGRYSDAKKAFKTALLHLTVLHQKHQGDEFADNSTIRIETITLPESADPAACEHSFYLYRDAYLAHIAQSTTSEEQPSTLREIGCCMTVLITFNLSLALQYKLDTENLRDLKKLLRLYKGAWEALQITAKVIPERQTYRDTIAIAILNNTGITYYYAFSNHSKARLCFESMKNILLIKDDENTTIGELMPEVRNGLMMN
eukprot:CAMPEP_0178896426 /NCGR_PEP_ID=MMETSP0786-20121207/1165_1 /TAXON_ID=186022 /ORGANISM="Thalassionema frauenfeldii, Strain CCMP 1798" /LENGTH=215 /DNA_ID=CAMNT_0020566825 /DNA_START=1 /DNA_END=645 /DNA_ORIENTATION=+